jgi:hypothetical protein
MKKIIVGLFSFLFIVVIVISCNDSYNENQKIDKYELDKLVSLKKSTDNVSDIFLNMGVTEINVSHESNSVVYNAKTEKDFNLNGENIDLSNYTVILKEGKISLISNPSFELTIYQNQPYIVSPSYTGFTVEDYFMDKDFNLLLLFMKEITTEIDCKISAQAAVNDFNLKSASCSFWNTYYVYTTGGSRSVAESRMPNEINEYSSSLGGCSAIGGIDSSCLWENHGCIATQAFCCN